MLLTADGADHFPLGNLAMTIPLPPLGIGRS